MLNAVVTIVSGAVAQFNPEVGPQVIVGKDNLPFDVLSNIVAGNPLAGISVFDGGASHDDTKWMPYEIQTTQTPTYITSTLSANALAPAASATITIGNIMGQSAPNLGDSISAVVANGPLTRGTVATATANMTNTQLAALLATNINNINAPTHNYLTATSSGNVVTLTNVASFGLLLTSYVGNAGARQYLWAQQKRPIQICLYTASQQNRWMIGQPILDQLAYLQANYGVQLADNTALRIMLNSDQLRTDAYNNQLYVWDFIIDVEWGLTTSDEVYSILAPEITKQLG